MEKYYSLDECRTRDVVIERLDRLKSIGKIDYDIDIDILEIEDIELEDDDIDMLEDFLDDNDVIPYYDKDDEDVDEDYDDFYGDYDDDY